MARRGRNNDGKYLRLTGLWPSKNKDGLWTGKFRNQDLEKLQEKVQEALDNRSDMAFFLWENDGKSRKDPEFTLQTTVSDSDGGGRSRYGNRSSRDRDDDRDDDRGRRSKRDRDDDEEDEKEEEQEEQEQDEEEEDDRDTKSKKSSKATQSSKSSKPAAKGTRQAKKDEDW